MRNIKLTLAYDGTEFHGWQIQPGQPTVQGALADVLCKITQEQVTVHGAGRTDAGVHARGQVAHFKTAARLAPQEFQRALNALLPPAVRVVAAEEVSWEFHARHDAAAKTYVYRIFRGPVVPPFLWRYVLHYPFPLDEDAMRAAAPLFMGTHDFTSFAAPAGAEEEAGGRGQPSPLRTILRSEFLTVAMPAGESGALAEDAESSRELRYTVRGQSFLRYMVRKMVGTLLEIGRGRMKPDDIHRLFEARDRSQAGPTVAPHGLCMWSVEYGERVAGTPASAVGVSR
jgi:tRNA pseudouridine38-40 synthase